MKTVALIVAAGSGRRFGGDIPKQFRPVHQRPLLAWTIRKFEQAQLVDDIVVVVAEDYLLYTSEKIVESGSDTKVRQIIKGGDVRRDSVARGLNALPISTGFVAIHDGARPIVDEMDIDRVIEAAHKERAAILARPVTDSIKRVEGDYIIATLDRGKLFQAETPQVFQYDLIRSAHEQCPEDEAVTDDASMVERLGFKVRTVVPNRPNIKVTLEDDLKIIRGLIDNDR